MLYSRVLRINTEATAPLPPLSRTPHSDAASRRRIRLRLRPRRQRLRLVPSLLQHQVEPWEGLLSWFVSESDSFSWWRICWKRAFFLKARATMEHGSLEDSSASTFSIMEEDHTLANSQRNCTRSELQFLLSPYVFPLGVLFLTFDGTCANWHSSTSFIVHFHTVWSRLLENAVENDVELVLWWWIGDSDTGVLSFMHCNLVGKLLN